MRGVLDAIAEFRSYPLRFLEALGEGATMNRRQSSAAPGSGVPGAAAERPEAGAQATPSTPAASGHPNQHSRKETTVSEELVTPMSAHSGLLLRETPDVHEVRPGRYVADFGSFALHFNEDQWNDLDSRVRGAIAGILETRAKASA